ncbi:hypothetical protein UAJ10_13980 [Nitrospirillum sp. BR 11164]|uniref:hypothetical protein n=1 Tax=Nitrospirillum sp. BR 11164 TaxID=3104324 RepID=UPI002AFE3176|nr:hypothetical protein [Nitrospirillum sp. BR 11164]MEA1650115.1 hypothetical protein [Nitrospirillum sp. BR 11164]
MESITQRVHAQLYVDDPAGRGGMVEFHDGYQFVQCRHLPQQTIVVCEAGGTRGQPWLRHALTQERLAALKGMGFTADRQTGNFIRRWDPAPEPKMLMAFMVHALDVGYSPSGQETELQYGWFPAQACPPRVAAGNAYGGAVIFDGTKPRAAQGCRLEPVEERDDKPLARPPAPPADASDAMSRQQQAISAAVTWVAGGTGPEHRIAILSWGDFYIQCMKAEDPSMQCEVVSADVMPRLKRVLNAAAGRRLRKLGFLEPGYSMNYIGWFRLNDGKPENWAWSTMRAALTAFGGYAIQPVTVERRSLKGET